MNVNNVCGVCVCLCFYSCRSWSTGVFPLLTFSSAMQKGFAIGILQKYQTMEKKVQLLNRSLSWEETTIPLPNKLSSLSLLLLLTKGMSGREERREGGGGVRPV